MGKKITTIKCPQCGSTKHKRIDDEHFECLNCGTGYLLDTNDLTINHNYHYPPTTVPHTPVHKKGTAIVLVVLFFGILTLVASNILFKNDSEPASTLFPNATTWNRATAAQSFVDGKGAIKLFIVGSIGAERNNLDKGLDEQLYWSVYDISSGKTEQLHAFENLSASYVSGDLAFGSFADGFLYFVFKKMHVYQYDIASNSLQYLNPDLEKRIGVLKTGIGSIDINHNYNCLDIVSNTGNRISYFPSSKLQLPNPESPVLLSGPVTQTQFAVSRSNPNFIVQYEGMFQEGMPIYTNPVFSIVFDADENPIQAVASPEDMQRARVNKVVLFPNQKRMHQLHVLGWNGQFVAIAFKENIQEGEKYRVQLLNYKGLVQWDLKTNVGFVAGDNHLVSGKNEVLLNSNHTFYLIHDGKIKKTLNLEDIVAAPNQ